jgi:hypothetical protein
MAASKSAALATVFAAWQAETPIISCFYQRPLPTKATKTIGIEQQGLIGLTYSFIHQLLQFSRPEDRIDVCEQDLTSLDGSIQSWEASLRVLRALLVHTPQLMFCVIDGLGDLAWGSGGRWCDELLGMLLDRQKQPGTLFHILLTTTGNSQVLPKRISFKDRHITTKRAREITRLGKLIDL